ncbi:glycosyltransferase family 4 protein [bacterium]|nr:glycosyltransferase family 4 protein [candidate division CSSED10-310 bacterium]
MKICLITLDTIKLPGVAKKIFSQANALSSNGCTISLFAISSFINTNGIPLNQDFESSCIYFPQVSKSVNPLQKFFYRLEIFKAVAHFLRETSPDVVYFRYPLADAGFLKLIHQFPETTFITEHQTKEIEELWVNHAMFPLLSELFWGGKLRYNLSAITSVTSEICQYEQKKAGREIPAFVAPNGIEVTSVPLRTPPVFNGQNIEIICVAQVAKWHGLDRLILGIANSGNKKVFLHIVGDGPAIQSLQELVKQKALEEQVIFHGFKTGKDLDEFFDKCHIAVGSLGIHRLGLTESSVLKVREYCARGIPFIYSPIDADFPDSFPYRLKVPADESPINIEEVLEFAGKILDDKKHPEKMREFATQNLDWTVKMKRLKSFFEEVIAKERS